MKQFGDKKTRFNEYHDASYDDVRTIPDFYDNLYPTADRPEQDFSEPINSRTKKRENRQKKENPGETKDEI